MNGQQDLNVMLRRHGILIAFVVLVVILAALATGAFVTVGPGLRGILIRLGAVQERVLDEGLHFKIPGMDIVEMMDVKTQKVEESGSAASKDLQDVETTIVLNYHVIPAQAWRLRQQIGLGFEDVKIVPAIHETIKAVTAQYTAEELITKRPLVRQDMTETLREKLKSEEEGVDDFFVIEVE